MKLGLLVGLSYTIDNRWLNVCVCRCISEGTIVDNGQLICLYLLARLLQRELEKCLRLVTFLPMQDMDKHFGLKENIKM